MLMSGPHVPKDSFAWPHTVQLHTSMQIERVVFWVNFEKVAAFFIALSVLTVLRYVPKLCMRTSIYSNVRVFQRRVDLALHFSDVWVLFKEPDHKLREAWTGSHFPLPSHVEEGCECGLAVRFARKIVELLELVPIVL